MSYFIAIDGFCTLIDSDEDVIDVLKLFGDYEYKSTEVSIYKIDKHDSVFETMKESYNDYIRRISVALTPVSMPRYKYTIELENTPYHCVYFLEPFEDDGFHFMVYDFKLIHVFGKKLW